MPSGLHRFGLAVLLGVALTGGGCTSPASGVAAMRTTGPVVVEGTTCDKDGAQACGLGVSLKCDAVTKTWKVEAACAPGEVCVGSEIVVYPSGNGVQCCHARPTFDCQELCEHDADIQEMLNADEDGGLPLVASILMGCDAKDPTCVCALFGKKGPGQCLFACHQTDDYGDLPTHFVLSTRDFVDVQVVSAFPAHVGTDGVVARVCGGSLGNAAVPVSNSLELTLNLVSTELKVPSCNEDRDQSIKGVRSLNSGS